MQKTPTSPRGARLVVQPATGEHPAPHVFITDPWDGLRRLTFPTAGDLLAFLVGRCDDGRHHFFRFSGNAVAGFTVDAV